MIEMNSVIEAHFLFAEHKHAVLMIKGNAEVAAGVDNQALRHTLDG